LALGPAGPLRTPQDQGEVALRPHTSTMNLLQCARSVGYSSGLRGARQRRTRRLLPDSLDLQSTLTTTAGVALPLFGTWCIVDVVDSAGTISRVSVVHPDVRKQRAAREYYLAHPPHRDDPIGAARVIRTSESEFVVVAAVDALDAVTDDTHRDLLRDLGARCFLIVPMRARERTLGAITFVSEEPRQYDDADLLLAEDLGRRCAMAIDNARLFGEAEAARELASYAAQRADALRASAEDARQEADAANKAKASFLTRMSHEFRTPLGIVLGYVAQLTEGVSGAVNDAQRLQLHRIEKATKHLLGLIEEILTLSQINAGYGEAHLEELDLSALLVEACGLLAPLAHAKRLSLALDVPDAPIVALTDAGKFRQIIFNLTSNAVTCTKTGGIRVSLVAQNDDVFLRVSDSGIGISATDAEHLFESFWQVRRKDSPAGGTGLGLAITRQLAQLLGGDVHLESSNETGSTFLVRLPILSDRRTDPLLRRHDNDRQSPRS
jgi:signal transduction histidine kinase